MGMEKWTFHSSRKTSMAQANSMDTALQGPLPKIFTNIKTDF